ncbi:MAG TPA: hypothetical protein VGK38_14105 [Prolixibacteraceae bacterium]|jgi:hypothetical protein
MNTLKIIIYTSLLFLHWIPRILGVIFALAISLFATDVLDNGSGFWKTLLAVIIHLIPSFILITVLVLSWKRPWIGGIGYILLGIVYIIWSSQSGRGSQIIDIPLFSAGILFLINWFLRKQIKIAKDAYEQGY